MTKSQQINAMTIDVEDYFQVSAFENHVPRAQWDSISPRVEQNTDRILGLFETYGVHGTFFVLGWVAERFPSLVRRIHDAGHEIASHGYSHVRATTQSSAEFKEDVTKTKKILEDASGSQVQGFRAASFSIGAENLWALDVLADVGYRYSSSIYPVRHDLYGMPGAPRFPFEHGKSGFFEIPISTVRVLNRNLPAGGGGYFRLLPYGYFKWAIRRINDRDEQPAVFYFHPWEIDPSQPRYQGLGLKSRLRHYLNLGRTESRLHRLMNDFSWDRMDRIYLDSEASVRREIGALKTVC
jgi:polysaccharide deacetylase family protein (PEP-CTERM system associated)